MTKRYEDAKDFAKRVHKNINGANTQRVELETPGSAVISMARGNTGSVLLETEGYYWQAADLRFLAKALKKLADRMDPTPQQYEVTLD